MKKINKKGIFILIGILIFWILLFLAIGLSGSGTTKNDAPKNNSNEKKQPQTIVIKDVYFTIQSYKRTESILEKDNYYILIPIQIKNNSSKNITISPNNIQIDSTDSQPITMYDIYFNDDIELLPNVDREIDCLFKFNKSVKLEEESLEIDLSIFSLGKNIEFKKLNKEFLTECFEEITLKKMGVNEIHIDKLLEIISIENLGMPYNIIFEYSELLKEKLYMFKCLRGTFALFLDEALNFSMFDCYENQFYVVYQDGVKNPYYLSTSRIIKEYNTGNWQSSIRSFVDSYYIDASCSDFKWGRVVDLESAMGISFTTKGRNAFGVTLIKSGCIYLIYNSAIDDFEISYLNIGEDIIVDNRIVVSFETGTIEDISSKKIMKTGTVEAPELQIHKEGYLFLGWRESGSDEFFDFNTKISKNTKLIAVWEKCPVINCELVVDETVENIKTNIVNIEYVSRFTLPIPFKNLYDFKYWYYIKDEKEVVLTDSSGRSLNSSNLKEKIAVYPKFEYSPKGKITDVTFDYDEIEDGYFIKSFKGFGDIFFPNSHNDKPVIGIRKNSFSGYLPDAKEITSVTFPAGFKFVDDDFIHYSIHVENAIYIYFDNPDSLIELGYSQRINAINQVQIGRNCNKIKNMFVKNGNILISGENKYFIIENFALYSYDHKIIYYVMSSDSKFYLNDSVEHINDMAFANCSNLEVLHLSKNLKSIEKYSFYINGGCLKIIIFIILII